MTKEYKKAYNDAFESWCLRPSGQEEVQQWKSFISRIKAQTRLEILFDADMSQVLLDSIRVKRQGDVDALHQHLKHLKLFTHFLHTRKFIGANHYQSINEAIAKERSSNDSLKVLSLAVYLPEAQDRQTFEMQWAAKSPIPVYSQFWAHYLKTDNVSLRNKLNVIYEAFLKFNLDQHLDTQVLEGLADCFKGVIGKNSKEIMVNQYLQEFAESKILTSNSILSKELDQDYELIKRLICEFQFQFDSLKEFHMKIGRFGSLVNGFGTEDSDLDITILTNCYIQEKKFIQMLSTFLQVKLADNIYKVVCLATANIPIVQIKKNQKGPNFQKIDIAVNNICGVMNSKFLKVYSELHPGIRYLGVLIKIWGKASNVIAQKKLSSYSLIMMMLYYLIKAKVVDCILHNINKTDQSSSCIKMFRTKKNQKETFIIENVFQTDLKKIKPVSKKFNIYKHFLGFLEFYREGGTYFAENRSIQLDQIYTKALEVGKVYTIKDPFDTPHNPGRVDIEFQNEIFRPINQAIKILKTYEIKTRGVIKGIEDLFVM